MEPTVKVTDLPYALCRHCGLSLPPGEHDTCAACRERLTDYLGRKLRHGRKGAPPSLSHLGRHEEAS